MQQLTGLDAGFLAMESAQVYGHVGSIIRLDPATAPQPLTLQRLTGLIASRLHLVPLLHRRLVEVPWGLDQPYWVTEPQVSLDYHVREIALPAPGSDAQLVTQVARLHARPLDRSHPLWEVYLITGLAGGLAAVYSKVHHAAIDGVAGDDLLAAVLDLTPDGRRPPGAPDGDPSEREPEEPPGSLDLLARSALSLAKQPLRAVQLGGQLVRRTPGLAAAAVERLPLIDQLPLLHQLSSRDPGLPTPALRAPHTPFNASISPHRRVAIADLSLAEVKRVKNRAGLTVNDVVMAISAAALRRWLITHDALPDSPLIAAVPVSVRRHDDHGSYGNKVSATLATLPTDVADPLRRLHAAAEAMRAAKADHSTIPPTLLEDATGLTLPLMAGLGWRLAARLRLMERVNPFNLFISNVPGPSVPLYYAGARMTAYYPVSAIAHGQGLNITVASYTDRLCFGLLACRSLVPDLDTMAESVYEELDALLAATA